MQGVLNQIFSGIATGGIYASVALALVMIYTATHHINFAQGEMAMFSTYIALTLIQAGLPYWVAFIITVPLSFVIGAIIQRVLMNPMANAPVLASVSARASCSCGQLTAPERPVPRLSMISTS